MKMQSDMGYWKTKIQQTEANVKEAQDIADVTETEFKVGTSFCWFLSFHYCVELDREGGRILP
jgi:hypothetical protein